MTGGRQANKWQSRPPKGGQASGGGLCGLACLGSCCRRDQEMLEDHTRCEGAAEHTVDPGRDPKRVLSFDKYFVQKKDALIEQPKPRSDILNFSKYINPKRTTNTTGTDQSGVAAPMQTCSGELRKQSNNESPKTQLHEQTGSCGSVVRQPVAPGRARAVPGGGRQRYSDSIINVGLQKERRTMEDLMDMLFGDGDEDEDDGCEELNNGEIVVDQQVRRSQRPAVPTASVYKPAGYTVSCIDL